MWRYPKMIYQAVFCKSFCYSRQLCYLQVRGKLTLRLWRWKFIKQTIRDSQGDKIAQYLIKHFIFKYKFEVA